MAKIKEKIIYLDGTHLFNDISYWVIRTNESEPRFIELILTWFGTPEYSLVYNIHYARVWKGIHPPYKAMQRFQQATGLDAVFQEVPEEAYAKFKSYEAYFNGQRELTEDEINQLNKEWIEYSKEHGTSDYRLNEKSQCIKIGKFLEDS